MAKAKKSAAKAKTKKATQSASKAKKASVKKPTAKTASKASSKKTSKPTKKAVKATPKKVVKAAPKSKGGAKKAPLAKSPAKSTAKSVASKASAPVKSSTKVSAKATKGAAIDQIFTPLDDRVVVEKAGVADRTPGGLYIPETVADRPNQGRVVAVGRGHRDKKGRVRPLDVQLGDVVMYGAYAGSQIELNGVEVLVLREEDILAVVKS